MTNAVNIAQSGSNNVTMRNRLINGAMVIDVRNLGAPVVLTTAIYTLDRWQGFEVTDGSMTVQQSSVAPTGFTNSLLCTTTTADASLGADQYACVGQKIEGFNIADFGWGTANAQPGTISFWTRSSLTGTFGGNVRNGALNRSYPFTYTISSANTWEYKTITIPGDTTGTWATNNNAGIEIIFGLGVGSTNSGTAGSWQASNFLSSTGTVSVIGTLSATWQITGVQFEKGTAASPFEYRFYTTELQLCQRYFWRIQGETAALGFASLGTGSSIDANSCFLIQKTPVRLRTNPTLSFNGSITQFPSSNAVSGIINTYSSSSFDTIFAQLSGGGFSGAGVAVSLYTANNSNNWFAVSAEL